MIHLWSKCIAMNNPRRTFLSQLSLIAGAAALSKPLATAAAINKHINTLSAAKNAVTVYHTNDLRGNIATVYKNMGGLDKIKTELENQETGGLLLDAGNFINASQSLSQQKKLVALMNKMGYHAAAIGGQELSLGQDRLASLAASMTFTLLNCNYDFNNSLSNLVKPYTVMSSGRFKIGITAVGQQFEGIHYNDAIKSANNIAQLLKIREKCDLVICLSHLGFELDGDKPDSHKLAAQSEHIDIIIGGNNDKMLSNAKILHNKLKHEVILAQTAWDGLMLGRTIINFDRDKQKYGLRAKHFIPGVTTALYPKTFSDLQLVKNVPIV
jgi:5'-nucleotidase